MKPIYHTILRLTMAFVILSGAAVLINNSIDLQNVVDSGLSAEKPLFGADEYEYVAPKADQGDTELSSRINWALLVFTILLVMVLANAFDISKYTAKITGRETVNQNNVNKWLMLIIMIAGLSGAAWEYVNHGKHILLNDSSSEHGVTYDSMFSITLILTSIVFFITQFLLFWFSFSYAKKEGKKALYYAHNNKLEVFWTIIPALVLTMLVLRGHQTWRSVVYAEENHPGKIKSIEVFAFQFGWKARYAGADGVMGASDYKFISGKNELGLAYRPEVDALLEDLNIAIAADKKSIEDLKSGKTLQELQASYTDAENLRDYKSMESIQKEIDEVNCGARLDDIEASIKRKTKQIERIQALSMNKKLYAATFNGAAEDDIIVQEIYLAKDSLVTLNFRSKDIIHSAWIPHFRAQMNVVPGMPTKFTFRPTKTTAEAKKERGEEFEYYLYCNKICGVSHYNMKMRVVVVDSQKEVDEWLKSQQPAFRKTVPAAVPAILNTDSTGIQKDTTVKIAFN